MRIKITSFFLCIVLLAFASTANIVAPAAAMAAPTEYDIADDSVVLETCGDECPGHIITGTSQSQNNIRILSGDHKITLKDLNIPLTYPSPDTPDNDATLTKFSALYIAEGVNNVDITIEGYVLLVGYKTIPAKSTNLTFHGTESSDFNVAANIIGIEAKNLTVDGGNLSVSAAGSGALESRIGIAATETLTIKNADIYTAAGAATNSYAIIAKDLTIENSKIEALSGVAEDGTSVGITFANSINVKDSNIRIRSGEGYYSIGIYGSQNITFQNVTLEARSSKGGELSSGIYMDSGIATIKDSEIDLRANSSDKHSHGALFNNLNIIGSILYTDGGNAENESAGLFTTETLTAQNSEIDASGGNDTQYSYGIYVANALNATDSIITGNGGNNVERSDGIYATNALNATDSTITGNGGKATRSSFGIEGHEADITNGLIAGYGSDECEGSFGISIWSFDDDLGFLKLTNANIIAWGNNKSVRESNMNFPGITYQADENAEPVTTRDYSGKEFYFGNQYKVIYDANGIEAKMPEAKAYYYGENFEISNTIPTAQGYTFLGWSDDPADTVPLYEVNEKATFVMGDEDVTFYAIWKCLGGKSCILNDFSDLTSAAWYHDGICYCLNNGIMNGTSKTTFAPDAATTRAMIVTTLWRMAGECEAENSSDFPDVPSDTWYTKAVNWAAEIGIVNGYEDGSFRPDQPATREELAAILGRYNAYNGNDLTADPIPATYTDKDQVSDWAAEYMTWAIDSKIINGMTTTTLVPQGIANRAQLATMLQRFESKILN